MIKNSDRKILWAKAGNKCSMCDTDLTMKAESGKDIVVGEEAHIISERINGPRHKNLENYDTYDNLILLCPTHHSIIDKNSEDYSVEKLISIKEGHEKKINERTSPSKLNFKWTIYTDQNIKLKPILTGSELIDIVYGSESHSYSNDEPETREEADLISSLFGQLDDCDVLLEIPSAVPGLQMEITDKIRALWEKGLIVIGTKEKSKAKFQNSETPWRIAHVSVVRASGSKIVRVHVSEKLKKILEDVKSMSPEEIKKKLESMESEKRQMQD